MESNNTWNQHVVKKANRALVLRIIHERSPISRAAIAQVTELNKLAMFQPYSSKGKVHLFDKLFIPVQSHFSTFVYPFK